MPFYAFYGSFLNGNPPPPSPPPPPNWDLAISILQVELSIHVLGTSAYKLELKVAYDLPHLSLGLWL